MKILITGTAGLPSGIIFKFFKNSQKVGIPQAEKNYKF